MHHVPILYNPFGGALLGRPWWRAAFGSTRWIPLPGGIHLQVSEFVKPCDNIVGARYLTS